MGIMGIMDAPYRLLVIVPITLFLAMVPLIQFNSFFTALKEVNNSNFSESTIVETLRPVLQVIWDAIDSVGIKQEKFTFTHVVLVAILIALLHVASSISDLAVALEERERRK